ncbi:MAG: nitroreductase [Catenulispora sp.]|nr:nitroreductase [Catenulispora sp.]
MSEPYEAVWDIDELDYPAGGTNDEILRFILRYAVLAPSGHNGQPWSFHLEDGVLHVRADRTRALPTVDPDDRELLIACAATVHLATLALEHFGHYPGVRLLPDDTDPDLLAVIAPGARGPMPASRELFDAIVHRRSNRAPYLDVPPSDEELARLRGAAAAHGAWLHPITEPDRIAAAADLIADGDRIRWREPVFRAELARRLIPNRGERRDGIPGYAFGVPGVLAPLAPLLVRHVDLGRACAASDRKLTQATPALAVIGTDTDEPIAWLHAGLALSHVLLRATADQLATSFMSQAIEVPELRPRLAELLGHSGYPQLLLRVGYPTRDARPAPRRDVATVLAGTSVRTVATSRARSAVRAVSGSRG